MSTITVHLVPANGTPIDLPCNTGGSLMQAAVDANVDGIAADCGGMMTCATCHVYVREAFLAEQHGPPARQLDHQRGHQQQRRQEDQPEHRDRPILDRL